MGSKGEALFICKDGIIEWWGHRGITKHVTIRRHSFDNFKEIINSPKTMLEIEPFIVRLKEEIKDGKR